MKRGPASSFISSSSAQRASSKRCATPVSKSSGIRQRSVLLTAANRVGRVLNGTYAGKKPDKHEDRQVYRYIDRYRQTDGDKQAGKSTARQWTTDSD